MREYPGRAVAAMVGNGYRLESIEGSIDGITRLSDEVRLCAVSIELEREPIARIDGSACLS
jgi:hypothetical protein